MERRANTWELLLLQLMQHYGESFEDIEANTMSEEEMKQPFDSGFGSIEGIPFTVWTKNRVYFPVCYDGSAWVGSVSRNPDGKPTEHQGG